MQKKRFITVMAILDEESQRRIQGIRSDFIAKYGEDTHTPDVPFHITLGSYAIEDTDEIVRRIHEVASSTASFPVRFTEPGHFGHVVRFLSPEIGDALLRLHSHFDSDYANGYPGWMPHVTVYRHPAPTEAEWPAHAQLCNARIVGIELGEFFPAKKIVRVMFGDARSEHKL